MRLHFVSTACASLNPPRHPRGPFVMQIRAPKASTVNCLAAPKQKSSQRPCWDFGLSLVSCAALLAQAVAPFLSGARGRGSRRSSEVQGLFPVARNLQGFKPLKLLVDCPAEWCLSVSRIAGSLWHCPARKGVVMRRMLGILKFIGEAT